MERGQIVEGFRIDAPPDGLPDLLAVASFYKDWAGYGAGVGNYMVYGEYPETDGPNAPLYLPSGVIRGRDLANVEPLDPSKITEYVTHSWFEYGDGDGQGIHPSAGETSHNYTGPAPPYDRLNTDGKYSWLKAPRYEGEPCEVGPLARVLVAYGAGKKEIKDLVDSTLQKLGVPVQALFSTLGRTAARGLETVAIGQAIQGWVMELVGNLKGGDAKTYQAWEMPDTGMGVGLNDVPRGSLGHWIEIENKKIRNYQYVVPSTWNLGPRDEKGKLGPVEEALIGTPIADPKRPLEVLRTVHSFDPCIACGVHVIDPDSNQVYKVRAL